MDYEKEINFIEENKPNKEMAKKLAQKLTIEKERKNKVKTEITKTLSSEEMRKDLRVKGHKNKIPQIYAYMILKYHDNHSVFKKPNRFYFDKFESQELVNSFNMFVRYYKNESFFHSYRIFNPDLYKAYVVIDESINNKKDPNRNKIVILKHSGSWTGWDIAAAGTFTIYGILPMVVIGLALIVGIFKAILSLF